MKKVYILIGPPGAGKGTQAELLSQRKKLNLVQPGNILRQEIKRKTKLGRLVKPYVDAGNLVPDDLVNQIGFDRLSKSRREILLDGFPRTVAQAKKLIDFSQTKQIYLEIIEIKLLAAQIYERIAGRRSCSCGSTYHIKYNPPKKQGYCDKCGRKLYIRKDSRPEIIVQRIKVYRKQTQPVLKFFHKLGISHLIINGNQDLLKVNKDISKKIK
jgi:adenylate kinase